MDSVESFDRMAQYLDEYVKPAENIDTQHCPRDFAEAYYRNIAARSDQANAWRSHPHIPTGDEAFMRGVIGAMQGDLTGGMAELKNQFG